MQRFSAELKIGLFTVLAACLFAVFMLKTRDAPFGPGGSYSVFTTVPSAEGIQLGSIVSMAGVQVGRVGTIVLTPSGDARVELQLRSTFQLPKDSVATVKSMGMLGDRTIHLLPGPPSGAYVQPGDTIPYAEPKGDLDTLTRQMGTIAEDIKAVTSDLRVVSDAIKTIVTEGDMKASVQRVLNNLEDFTSSINTLGRANQDELSEIVSNFRSVSETLKGLMGTSQNVLETSGRQVSDQIVALQQATARLNDVLVRIDRIAASVERGEGTVGALLNERTTVDALNATIDGANQILDRINRFRTRVTYRGDYYAFGGPFADSAIAGSMKSTLDITFAGRSDYYYVLGLVSDPAYDSFERWVASGDDPSNVTRTRVYTDDYQLTFQFARRWRNLALRLGVRENHGGVGADYFFAKDRLALSLDLFDFSTAKAYPNLEARFRYDFYNHLYVSAGFDDMLNRIHGGGVNLFVGGGFTFEDDDLKYLLAFVPFP